MTMVSNAYQTHGPTFDYTIPMVLVAGFFGQLKGWWDNILTLANHTTIFQAIM